MLKNTPPVVRTVALFLLTTASLTLGCSSAKPSGLASSANPGANASGASADGTQDPTSGAPGQPGTQDPGPGPAYQDPSMAPPDPLATGAPVGTPTAYLAVSTEMIDVWHAMKDSDHWFYRLQRSVADKTGTADERYADHGLSAGWIYLVTKDPVYAQKAWQRWKLVWGTANTLSALSMNNITEQFMEGVILGSWIYETLTPAERTTMLSTLSVWADWVLEIGTAQYEGGMNFADSDLLTGEYFGLVALDLWNVPENLRHGKLLDKATQRFNRPVGGMVATSADLTTTARNAIRAYAERMGASGEWIESSEYNAGTLKLLLMGYQLVRVAGHADKFPELQTYVQKAAEFYTHAWTAGWQTVDQWADDENARDTNRMVYTGWATTAMLAGLAGSSAAGKHAQWAAEQLYATRGDQVAWNGTFNIRAIISPWNPMAAGQAVDYTKPVATGGSRGTGRFGVKRSDASLWFYGPNRELYVHHQGASYAGFKLWRDGEWVLNNPVGYGPQARSSFSTNSLLLAGLSSMAQAAVTRVESGNDWWSMTYDTQGSCYPADQYQAPAPFVSRATRRMVYFREPSGWDVIVVRDDVVADNPLSMSNAGGYDAATRATIEAALARSGGSTKELVFWMPTGSPVQSGNTTEWTTPGGKTVRLVHLLPTTILRGVSAGSAVLGNDYSAQEKNAQFQLRVSPATVQSSDVLLTVVLVGNGTPPAASVLDTADAHVGTRDIRFGDSAVQVTCNGGPC
jgi:hypothetical protein